MHFACFDSSHLSAFEKSKNGFLSYGSLDVCRLRPWCDCVFSRKIYAKLVGKFPFFVFVWLRTTAYPSLKNRVYGRVTEAIWGAGVTWVRCGRDGIAATRMKVWGMEQNFFWKFKVGTYILARWISGRIVVSTELRLEHGDHHSKEVASHLPLFCANAMTAPGYKWGPTPTASSLFNM